MSEKRQTPKRQPHPLPAPEGRVKPHHDRGDFDPTGKREYKGHDRKCFDPHGADVKAQPSESDPRDS